jgi:hypothetical protein
LSSGGLNGDVDISSGWLLDADVAANRLLVDLVVGTCKHSQGRARRAASRQAGRHD